jgi:hypothetical protein
MVSVFASGAADRECKPRSGKIKGYANGIGCFSIKLEPLMGKSNDWLARNQDNVSEWDEMSIRGLLFSP